MPPRASRLISLLPFAALFVSAAPAQPPAPPSSPSSIFGRLPPEDIARQTAAAVRLWAGRAPEAQGDAATDVPLLYPVLPVASATPSAALIVLPGGGYNYHSAAEAFPIAAHFRELGLATFVLQYRLRPYGPAVSLLDAQRAVRQLRARSAEFNLDPAHIAVLGFSAGGHLAANLSTHGDDGRPDAPDPVDRQSCRVQPALLIYPAILHARFDRTTAAGRDWTHLLALDGLHRLVDPHTPPTFSSSVTTTVARPTKTVSSTPRACTRPVCALNSTSSAPANTASRCARTAATSGTPSPPPGCRPAASPPPPPR